MKKIGFIVAALSVLSLAAPSIASAETVIVKHGHHHDWHPHHHKVIVIKHRH